MSRVGMEDYLGGTPRVLGPAIAMPAGRSRFPAVYEVVGRQPAFLALVLVLLASRSPASAQLGERPLIVVIGWVLRSGVGSGWGMSTSAGARRGGGLAASSQERADETRAPYEQERGHIA
jgi:hypothetical protein